MSKTAPTKRDAERDPLEQQDERAGFAARFLRVAARLSAPDLPPGARVSRYGILRKLGEGGQGQVYLAEDLELKRTVALKVLPSLAGAAEHREARALAMLRHPGIVVLFDLLAHAGAEILVMEYIEGPGTLRAGRDRLAAMSTTAIAALGRDVADALQAVHYVGVKHCDVKPDNIMLRADGTPVLIDFGIARSDAARTDLAESIEGTDGYMAPEQLRGEPSRERADVYALGVTLKECLKIPPAGGRRRKIPEDLRAICARATDPDPGRRQPTPGALRDSLQRFVDGLPVAERPLGWFARAGRAIARNGRVSLVAALVLALFAGGLWAYYRQERAASARAWTDSHRLAAQRGSWQEAIAAADRALKLGAADPVALRIGIVRSYMGLGDAGRALQELTALEAEPPGPHAATLQLIRSTVGINRLVDLKRGKQKVEAALASGGLGPAAAAYARGYLAEALPEAIDCFRSALQLDPFMQEARMHLVCLLLIGGQSVAARREIDRYRALYPTSQTGQCLEALYLLLAGDQAGADALLEPLEEAGVIGPAAIRLLGGLLTLVRGGNLDIEAAIAAAHPPPWADGDDRADAGELLWRAVRAAVPMLGALLEQRLMPRPVGGLPQFTLPPTLLPLVRGLVGVALSTFGAVTPERTADIAAALEDLAGRYPIGYLHLLRGGMLGKIDRYDEAYAALAAGRATPSIVPVRLLPEMLVLDVQLREHAGGWADTAAVPAAVAAKARAARTALLERGGLQSPHWSLLCAHAVHFRDRGDAADLAAGWRRAFPEDPDARAAAQAMGLPTWR